MTIVRPMIRNGTVNGSGTSSRTGGSWWKPRPYSAPSQMAGDPRGLKLDLPPAARVRDFREGPSGIAEEPTMHMSSHLPVMSISRCEPAPQDAATEGKTMEERVSAGPFRLKGDGGTPIKYEDIVLYRDVVFLVWDRPYSEEEQSGGAPASQTFYYTGYLGERSGSRFILSYFSCVVADGHLPVIPGTGILRDGGVGS